MKSQRHAGLGPVSMGMLALAAASVLATNGVSLAAVNSNFNANSGNWGDSTKWTAGIPSAASDVANPQTAANQGGTSTTTAITLATAAGGDTSFTIGTIAGGSNRSFSVSNIAGGTGVLNLDSGAAATAAIVALSGGGSTDAINVGLALNQDVSIRAAGSGAKSIAGAISTSAAALTAGTITNVLFASAASASLSNSTLAFSGAGTYNGATTIAANNVTGANSTGAAVSLGNDDRFPITTSLTISNSTFVDATNARGGGLLLSGHSQTVGRLTSGAVTAGAPLATIRNTSATLASTLTVAGNASGNSIFSGLLSNGGTGTLAFAATSGANVTFGGANTYTGGTTINGATLITANASALGTGSVSVTSSGNLTVGDGVANTVSGLGGLTLADATTLKLTAATSAITLASGTFTLGNINLDLNNNFNTPGTYTLITGAASGDAIGTTTFLNADTISNTYSFAVSGNNGVLTVTAVPEPAAMMFGLSLSAVLLRRRSRSNA